MTAAEARAIAEKNLTADTDSEYAKLIKEIETAVHASPPKFNIPVKNRIPEAVATKLIKDGYKVSQPGYDPRGEDYDGSISW